MTIMEISMYQEYIVDLYFDCTVSHNISALEKISDDVNKKS